MSITTQIKDSTLARLLFLEAKRQGFPESGQPHIHFVDLDTFPAPTDLPAATLVIGVSKAPEALSKKEIAGVFALLPLPPSVAQFTDICHRFGASAGSERAQMQKNALWLGKHRIPLSATEQRVLSLLIDHADRVVEDAELIAVLGESALHTNTLSVYLYRLRRKLSADGIMHIKRIRGRGYQWIESR